MMRTNSHLRSLKRETGGEEMLRKHQGIYIYIYIYMYVARYIYIYRPSNDKGCLICLSCFPLFPDLEVAMGLGYPILENTSGLMDHPLPPYIP